MRGAAPAEGAAASPEAAAPGWAVEAWFDGACPICAREVRWLGRLDHGGRIRFVDLAAPGFDPAAVGIPWEALMDRIHARLPDGRVVEGVEVFRQIWLALGWPRLVALTRLPGVRQGLDAAYRLFARNRLRLTGRCRDQACSSTTS